MTAARTRPSRLRRTAALRALVRETDLSADRLILPVFVQAGGGEPTPIASLPGVLRYPIDSRSLDLALDRIAEAGLGGALFFGAARSKTADGADASADDAALQTALHRASRRAPDLLRIADCCLCAFTQSGHCWLEQDGAFDLASTVDALAQVAVSLARAGADVIAPSGMVDGMVGGIRDALDRSGFEDRAVLSYAVKYASALYGPFREVADSAPNGGHRRAYQMDPANSREALREARLDEREGADWLMVKPALSSLDVIARVRRATRLPLAAYSVSGEYAMIKAAATAGWLDERSVVLELLGAIRRAGADSIITYHALDAARWLADRRAA
ncbi:MAG: porphobilinogen synthase [Gemmatimonadales bacterium]